MLNPLFKKIQNYTLSGLKGVLLASFLAFFVIPHSPYSQQRDLTIFLVVGLLGMLYAFLQLRRDSKAGISTACFVLCFTLTMFFIGPYAARRDLKRSVAYCERVIERAQRVYEKRGTYPKKIKQVWWKQPKQLLFHRKGCRYRHLSDTEVTVAVIHNQKKGYLFYSSMKDSWDFLTW